MTETRQRNNTAEVTSPRISPPPTEEEAAAIVAALTMAWPRPVADVEASAPSTDWRFSGRWWKPRAWQRRP